MKWITVGLLVLFHYSDAFIPRILRITGRNFGTKSRAVTELTKAADGQISKPVVVKSTLEEPVVVKSTLEDLFVANSSTTALEDYVFLSVSNSKPYVTWNDVIMWEFTRALIDQGVLTESKLKELFIESRKNEGANGENLTKKGFSRLCDLLCVVDEENIVGI